MKRILAILSFICLAIPAFATDYYISNEGSTANNGTSISTSWPFSKVNSFTFSPGDNIYFKRGETFYGTITVNQSGTAGNPITFGAYGTGNNPIITGFTTVSSWTNLGSNIWESTSTVSSLSSCKMVTINGVNTPTGRYPNTGWLTYQSHVAGTSITSSSISSATDWTGATAVIKKFRYVIDIVPITAQSGSTLTYSGSSGYDGQDGYGFFIENDVRTLDQQNEWYYNPSTKKIRVYSTSTPSNVNVASLDNLFYAVNKSYIVVNGIDFTGANADCFYLGNFANSTIENCNISFSLNSIGGYQFGGTSNNVVIQNNTINYSGNNGISLTAEFAGATISGNTIKNTGLLEGMALSGQTRWGVNTGGANYTISNNNIDSIGYNGIGFNGSSVLVDKNFVNHFCVIADDGAGIYTGNNQINVVISNNIVINGIGNYSGTTYTTPAANGIYCDDNSSGMTLLNNSISNVAFAAIFLHQAKNITVTGNTTFNSHIGLLIDRDNTVEHTVGINAKHNILIGNNTGTINTLNDQISIWCKTSYTTAGDIAGFGNIDSNIVARPIDDGNTIMGTIYGVADTYYTLSSWQTYSGFDLHSTKSPKAITSTDSITFVYNATSNTIIKSLSYRYLGVDNIYHGDTITLKPYSSAVLINNVPVNHYVSTAGNNSNAGTTANPWLTLDYAATQVKTGGDTIKILDGTYTITQAALIAPGISVKGQSIAGTILKSNYKNDWNFNDPPLAPITFSSSVEGTNGNQSISNLTLDGNNLTGNSAIVVKCRSNVFIHDMNIKDFYINGIFMTGSSVNNETQPTTYSTGNKIFNITIRNCSDSDATWVGGGNINIAGQKDLEIYNFDLSNIDRPAGRNGDNIINNRFGKGLHIHDGVSTKASLGNDWWNFHFEIPWGSGGTEIDHVTFNGGDCLVDIGGNVDYDYSYPHMFYIHDNYAQDSVGASRPSSHGKTAFAIEGTKVINVLIDNNKLEYITQPLGITDGVGAGIPTNDSNIVFSRNISNYTGSAIAGTYQNLIEIQKINTGGTIKGVKIINNTIKPNATVNSTAISITGNNSANISDIEIGSNVFMDGKNGYWMRVDNTGSVFDNLLIKNNNLFNNPNSNLVSFTGNPVTNYTNTANINADPLFISLTDLHLQATSPNIGAGYDYGYGTTIGGYQYVAPSSAPTISMSADQTNVTVEHTNISAVGTPYTGHAITSYHWVKVSGPSGGAITSQNSASTSVTGLTTGTYQYQCTVTQDDGLTASGTVNITVSIPVVIDAGTDVIIYLTPVQPYNSN